MRLLPDNKNLHYDALTILDLAFGVIMEQAREDAHARTHALTRGVKSARADVSTFLDALAYIKRRKRQAEKKPHHGIPVANGNHVNFQHGSRNHHNRVQKLLRSKDRELHYTRPRRRPRRT